MPQKEHNGGKKCNVFCNLAVKIGETTTTTTTTTITTTNC
jgi:hypothetical protein